MSTISQFPYRTRTKTPGLLAPAAQAQRHRLYEALTMQLTIHELVTLHDMLRILQREWRLHEIPDLHEQTEILARRLAAVLIANGIG